MRQELIPGAIAGLAGRQYGVVSRAQLRAIGLSDSAISRRRRAGSLHRLHAGVYAVGHTALDPRGRWMAAVLACGPDAALSHHAAGALWEMRATTFVLVDVTVPRTGARSRPGLRIHRPRRFGGDEVTSRDSIPVTTPARTILDLAATLSERELHRVLDEVQVRRLATVPVLLSMARGHRGHPGAGALTRALRRHSPGTTLTRSGLEERFLALCLGHGLPQPEVNARVAGLEVDFVFPSHRVAVETDGWRFHGHRAAFERDRRRDAALTRAGYRALRFTHDQVADEPQAVAATVAAALARDRAA